ncbi:MAG: UvrD-helicase domain-containing protein [Planctomycetota bacterium]|nr:UvrD-helicase domain-containing protein [Planctomycetota bacterium]
MSADLITANAGCGKTWTLANRCIGWLVQRRRILGTSDPEHLVAVTFTRKAAGEILDRVLDHVSSAILDPKALAGFSPGFNIDPPPTRDELISVLEDLAGTLHRLQLGTLDGLYNKIATSCATLIDMPANWSIGDEPTLDAIRSRSLDDLLDACDSEAIELLVHEAEREVLQSQVHKQLLPTVWGSHGGTGLLSLWRRTSVESGDRAWKAFDELDDDAIAPGARRATNEELAQACRDLATAPIAKKKDGNDMVVWVKTRAMLVEWAENRHWRSFLSHRLVQNMVQGQMYSKSVIPDGFRNAMEPLLRHALAELATGLKARMRSWRLLLHGLDRSSRRRQREAGAYSFQDVADLLAERDVLSEGDRIWLQYQLDAELRDLALDEFQDTSAAQFKVIEPIIEEILAGAGAHDLDRSLLIVADPKQAIYGWRGGTSALLDKVRYLGQDSLEETTLERSYRSGPAIIEFVNDLFESIGTNESILGKTHTQIPSDILQRCGLPETDLSQSPARQGLDAWHFDHHETAHPDDPSAVLAWRVERGEKRRIKIDLVAERVTDIVTRRRNQSGSMGILMPTNKGVTTVVEHLRKAGIPASEEGSGALGDSLAANAILSLLQLGDHPGNTEAAFRVSHSPLGSLVGLQPLETIDPGDMTQALAKVSLQIRRQVLDTGLEEYLISLKNELAPHTDAQDQKAIGLCIDLASAWIPTGVLRLSDFVQHVRTTSTGVPSGAAVRVMTLHKAKGLEFDEIILPILDEPLIKSSNTGSCFPWSPTVLDPVAIVMPEASRELRLHAPILEVGEQQRWVRDLSDRLSLLYVALTRARHVINLVFHVDDRDPDQQLTAGNIIRAALPDLDEAVRTGEEDSEGRIWMHTAAAWDDKTARTTEPPQATRPPRPIRFEPIDSVDPDVVAPSTHESATMEDMFKVHSTRARDRGTELHELFRVIEWLDDGPPDDLAIESALRQAAIATGIPPTEEQRQEVLATFNSALQHDEIAGRLSRAAYAHLEVDSLEVLQEWPILQQLEDTLVRGRLDRLVVGRRNGEVVFAEVVDFKSGPIGDDEAGMVEYYRPQLAFYAEVVQAHFKLDPEHVFSRLLFIDACRDLPCTPCQTAPSSS